MIEWPQHVGEAFSKKAFLSAIKTYDSIDEPARHDYLDECLCYQLRALGYGEAIDAYRAMAQRIVR